MFPFTFGFNDEMRKLMREKVSPILRQVVINVVVLLNCAGAHLLHAWETTNAVDSGWTDNHVGAGANVWRRVG